MQTVASMRIIREPDVGVATFAADRSLNLLTSLESATSISQNPLALLMTPAQLQFHGVSEFPIAQSNFDAIFDTVYARYLEGIQNNNSEQMVELASRYASAYPIEVAPHHRLLVEKANLFFRHRAGTATDLEFEFFLKSISLEALTDYVSQSGYRIDRLKTEVLSKRIQRDLGDSLNRLRVEACLVALLTVVSPYENGNREDGQSVSGATRLQPNYQFVRYIASVSIATPGFGFQEGTQSKKADDDRVASDDEQSGASPGRSSLKTSNTTPNCDCDCGIPECRPVDRRCDRESIKFYLADLLELREETHSYKASDLAYIENIAPREIRSRTHEYRKSIQDYTETEKIETRSVERDHQVTDRYSVQKQIEKQMSQRLDVDAKIKGTGYTVDTSASLSRDSAQREAREQFREMVTRAVQKIQTETRQLRSREITTESAETNVHSFDNSESDDAKVAKYFYVSQVKRGQVFSHGLRLMLDIFLPSPASLYSALEEKKAKAELGMDEPIRPDLSPSDIDPEVYTDYDPDWKDKADKTYRSLWEFLMEKYQIIDLEAPPERASCSAVTIGPLSKENNQAIVTIPEGCEATELILVGGKIYREMIFFKAKIELHAAGGFVSKHTDKDTTSSAVSATGDISVKVDWSNVRAKSWIQARLDTKPLPIDYSEWQETVHAAIMDKYEVELAEYNRALAAHLMRFKKERKLMHPFTAEEHIRTQMKQGAIYMLCDDFGDEVMNMKTEPCGYPTVIRPDSNKATHQWYFFDRAFDWEKAEFIFFDYFRNPICKWHQTFDPDEPNFLFKAFKRAGYARIQLPCAPGMEADVLKFLQDGKFWNGEDFKDIDTADPRYAAVVTEIKHSYNCHQNDRPGRVHAEQGSNVIMIRCSDFYWIPGCKSGSGHADEERQKLDLDREIFINGIRYRIVSIYEDRHDYDPDNTKLRCHNWKVVLDRPFEGETRSDYKHAVGAKFVGDPFFYDLPTDMVWLGDLKDGEGNPNYCLPGYPNYPGRC